MFIIMYLYKIALTLMQVWSPGVPSGQASSRTVQRRSSELRRQRERIAKGFKLYDGPFVKELATALASFNVRRQAYYSGTFVGNHVHRTLKVK